MKKLALVATVLGLAVLPLTHGSASAQVAASPPSTNVSAPAKEVYARDLMTFRERFDMWRAMRNARTMDEKMELWANKRVELEKRAAEKGVVLKDHGPMMMQNGHQENGGQKWGGENRMGMGSQGSGTMHPHPPAGR